MASQNHMLLTLIKALDTNKLIDVVGSISLPPIDIDLMLYNAQENGFIELSEDKQKLTVLKDTDEVYYDAGLLNKIRNIIRHYDRQEANITYNRLFEIVCNLNHPNERYGYAIHDFVCTMYQVDNSSDIKTYEIEVPEVKDKRPYNKFKFYTFVNHQEFGARAVNDFIDQFNDKKVK